MYAYIHVDIENFHNLVIRVFSRSLLAIKKILYEIFFYYN